MESINPLGGFSVLLMPLVIYAAIIYPVISLLRILKQISRDLGEIKESLRQSRSTTT